MKFEYDHSKSASNREKHGLSLEEAIGLWSVPNVTIEARGLGEPRFMVVGKLGEKLYSCIFTMRGDSIRLISARRSHSKEERIYHEHVHQKEDKR